MPIATHARISSLLKIAACALFIAFNTSGRAQQNWINPCASSNALTAQETTLANGTPSTDVCSFLDRAYEEVDNRCGISYIGFVKRIFEPTTWFKTQPYRVVPNADWQSIPLQAYPGGTRSTNPPWEEFSIPSLARLMTMAMPKTYTAIAATAPNDWKTLAESPISEPNELYFNPLNDPVILFDDGDWNSSHTITCSSAASASESGNMKLPLASISEKFTAQENSSTNMELAYGTFLSPMGYNQEKYPSSFLFQELDFYRRNPDKASLATDGTLFDYLHGVEGVIVYETAKGTSATDLSANASAGISVPLGGISGTASGEQKYGSAETASMFHALLRNEFWVDMDTPAQVTTKLQAIAPTGQSGTLISYTNPLAVKAAYDTKSGKVVGSFVIVGLPGSLCNVQLASPSFVPPDTKASLTAEHLSTAEQIKAAAKPPATPPPPGCVFTVTSDDSTGDPITGNLNYKIDVNSSVVIGFKLPYKLDPPNLALMPKPTTTTTTADFWVQVQQPDKIDIKQAASLTPAAPPVVAPAGKQISPSIACDGNPVDKPGATVAFATSYLSTTGSITGTFLHIQYQWAALKTAPTKCTPGDNITLISTTGAPMAIQFPAPNQ
jgi:hypothetical protein